MTKKLAQAFLLTLAIAKGASAFPQSAPDPRTWVKHVIIVVQENRTPDNLFNLDTNLYANNQGGDILPGNPNVSNAICRDADKGGNGYLPLVGAPLSFCANPDHSHLSAFEGSYDPNATSGRAWDNQCRVQADHYFCNGHYPDDSDNYTFVNSPQNPSWSPYPNNHLLDPYFQIAENYGFANYTFQTNQGPSFLAHQFLFSGTSAPVAYPSTYYWEFAAENPTGGNLEGGCASSDSPQNISYLISSQGAPDPTFPDEDYLYNSGYPCYNHASLADLLDHATPNPISWKYYIESPSYDNSIWTAPNALSAICQPVNGKCSSGSGNGDWQYVDDELGDILYDIDNCNLPAVSWVIPDGQWSDHPGVDSQGQTDADGGPSWVAAIVNAVGATKTCDTPPGGLAGFGNTVVLITWDDWGGFFDHVAPYEGYTGGYPNVSNKNGLWYTYGFRVPLLIVSQYTQNYISGSINPNNYQGETPPYIHDFGSILGFVEYTFGLNTFTPGTPYPCGIEYFTDQNCEYPYADFFALDSPAFYVYTQGLLGGCPPSTCPYPLSDFFNLTTPRSFLQITGAKYNPTCFQIANVNTVHCFPDYPADPDDE